MATYDLPTNLPAYAEYVQADYLTCNQDPCCCLAAYRTTLHNKGCSRLTIMSATSSPSSVLPSDGTPSSSTARSTNRSPFSLNDVEESSTNSNSISMHKPFVKKIKSHIPVGTLHDIEPSSSERRKLGIAYLSSMGVCGLVFVATSSNLNLFAERCNSTFLKLGSVFLARGIGSIMGSAASAKIYSIFPGNETIAASLFIVVVMLICMPSCHSLTLLHVYFFFCGLGTSLTDAGCQIMTRKIQGKKAGPWLGANTIAFGTAGAFVPLLEILTTDLYIQYLILAGVSLASVCSLWLGPDMEGYENYLRQKLKIKGRGSYDGDLVPHYRVEVILAGMGFWIVGSTVAITAYLNDYIIETKVIDEGNANVVVLVLWIAIATGKTVGIIDQTTLNDETCVRHLFGLLIGTTLAIGLIISDYQSSLRLWIGITLYGLFSGPRIGYVYDYLNRATYPTELSMSIVMFGVNLGASVVPYFVPWLWGASRGPSALMIVLIFSSIMTLPLFYLTIYCKYRKEI